MTASFLFHFTGRSFFKPTLDCKSSKTFNALQHKRPSKAFVPSVSFFL
jgi:hypothetical protein